MHEESDVQIPISGQISDKKCQGIIQIDSQNFLRTLSSGTGINIKQKFFATGLVREINFALFFILENIFMDTKSLALFNSSN